MAQQGQNSRLRLRRLFGSLLRAWHFKSRGLKMTGKPADGFRFRVEIIYSIYIYIYIYWCIYLLYINNMHVLYIYMYVCMYACMHVCMHAWMYVWMDACMHAWMYVWMDACMHVCIMITCVYRCMMENTFQFLFMNLNTGSASYRNTNTIVLSSTKQCGASSISENRAVCWIQEMRFGWGELTRAMAW